MSPSKLIKFALRLAVSVGLIWWVLRQVDTESFLGQLEKVSPAAFLLPVFVILGFGLIHTARWVLVQQALAAPLPFRLAARTIFLSLFFNQTLPSTIGGDAIRVTYAYRAGLPLNAVVKGVLVDRLSALLALVLMSASTLPLLYQAVGNHPFGGLVTLMVAGGLAGALALLALAALPPALRRWPGLHQAAGLADALWAVLRRPGKAALVLLTSLLIHVALGLIFFYLAWLLDSGVGPLICLTLYPPIMLVSMLPISIAGWGVREGAMVAAFTLVGASHADALAISLLFGAAMVVVGLCGVLIWYLAERWGRARSRQPG